MRRRESVWLRKERGRIGSKDSPKESANEVMTSKLLHEEREREYIP